MSDVDDQGLVAAAAALEAAESLVAVGHVNPDGDALGAALAIALAARAAGKSAFVAFGEPFTMPQQYRFLDTSPWLPVAEVPTPLDLLVTCDTARRERLGSAAGLADRASRVVIIDHHVPDSDPDAESFGDVRYIDSTAAATAEMAYRLIKHLGWKITPEVAAALYVGLVTDTGRFQYSATSPAVHLMAAELIVAGVRPEVVGRHIYEESPFGYLHVAGTVLGRAQLDREHALVWSTLFIEDLEKEGIGLEDADGLIDLIRIAEEAEVACLLRVDGSTVKVSLRSRGGVDVAAIAASHGGGGHHNASGFTHEGTPDAAIALVRGLL